jgi:dipeptidyl aminopeptidase/acylaminoacyl peptidase
MPALQAQPAQEIPTIEFFRNVAFDGALMSPSGKHVAATVKGGPKGRRGLVVFDTNDLTKSKALTLYANADVDHINWVSDDRIAFSIFDYSVVAAEQQFRPIYAVDREGRSDPRNLKWGAMFAALRDGSNDAIFIRRIGDSYAKDPSTRLMRINTLTGEETIITHGAPDGGTTWALDSRGNPRAAVSSFGGKSRLHLRLQSDSPWTVASEWQQYVNSHESPTPLVVDDKDRLYLVARTEKDSDTTSLYRMDMRSESKQWQPLVSLKGFDFVGDVILGAGGKLLGIRHLTDAWGTTWIDPMMKSIQAEVDKVLPNTINRVSCGLCADPKKVLVASWSDRQPTVFTLFDVSTKTLQGLGKTRPWIQSASMARRDFVQIPARDGLMIPAYVTRPAGMKEAGPMVVLVHGGPWVRGAEWEWDSESQFLAARGYVVIEPEFRGSVGFGFKHFRAGWKQWGLAMQDDLADATRWAVGKGYPDPKRVCIAGGSYGGYAALMGLVRHGDLYACGVSWSAVSDINLVYNTMWDTLSDRYKETGMPILVGDQDKDAAQLRETSPVAQAAKIKRPILLAHGGEDYRVTLHHATIMRRALEKNGSPHEWIYYRHEGHGWLLEETRVDFWNRVDAFLKKHTATK